MDALPVSGNHSNSQFVSCGSSPLLSRALQSRMAGKRCRNTPFAAAQKNIVSCIMAQRGARFQLRANYFPTSAGFPVSRSRMDSGWRGSSERARASSGNPSAPKYPIRDRLFAVGDPQISHRRYPEIRPPSGCVGRRSATSF